MKRTLAQAAVAISLVSAAMSCKTSENKKQPINPVMSQRGTKGGTIAEGSSGGSPTERAAQGQCFDMPKDLVSKYDQVLLNKGKLSIRPDSALQAKCSNFLISEDGFLLKVRATHQGEDTAEFYINFEGPQTMGTVYRDITNEGLACEHKAGKKHCLVAVLIRSKPNDDFVTLTGNGSIVFRSVPEKGHGSFAVDFDFQLAEGVTFGDSKFSPIRTVSGNFAVTL